MTVYTKETSKGARWYYQFIKKGKYYRGGGYSTVEEARQAEARVRLSVMKFQQEQSFVKFERDVTFYDLCSKYLDHGQHWKHSAEWYKKVHEFIKDQFSPWSWKLSSEITPQDIIQYLYQRSREVPSFVVKKELKMLISIFNFGVKYKLISFNPFKKIKNLPLEEHFQYFPSLEDFKSVYMVASQVEKQLLVLLLSTSARVGEILNLKWGDIKDGLITLKSNQYRGDTCKERQIPIPPLAWKAIGCLNKKYTSQSYEGFIFGKWRTGDQYVAKHKLMKKLCLKAGVKFFALHSIRRLALSIMSEEKVPLEVISYILGQSKVETKIVDFQLIQDNLSRIALMIDKTLGIEKDGYVQISE